MQVVAASFPTLFCTTPGLFLPFHTCLLPALFALPPLHAHPLHP